MGSHIRLTNTPISNKLAKTKFGTHLVDLDIHNTAASLTNLKPKYVGRVLVESFDVTFTGKTGIAIPEFPVYKLTESGNKKTFSKPMICKPTQPGGSSCKIEFKINKSIPSGKKVRTGIVVNTDALMSGSQLTMSIEGAKAVRYSYFEKIGKKRTKKVKYYLQSQLPFALGTIKK